MIWAAGAIIYISVGPESDRHGWPALDAVMVFAATALGSYAQNERLVRALRRRFEQRFAPDVVKRLRRCAKHASP